MIFPPLWTTRTFKNKTAPPTWLHKLKYFTPSFVVADKLYADMMTKKKNKNKEDTSNQTKLFCTLLNSKALQKAMITTNLSYQAD